MVKEELIKRWLNDIHKEMDELCELKEILLSGRKGIDDIEGSLKHILEDVKTTHECENVGEKIRVKRKELGLSQGELATVVGISIPMVCQIERGTKSVTLQLGAEIARVLGCDINDFIR